MQFSAVCDNGRTAATMSPNNGSEIGQKQSANSVQQDKYSRSLCRKQRKYSVFSSQFCGETLKPEKYEVYAVRDPFWAQESSSSRARKLERFSFDVACLQCGHLHSHQQVPFAGVALCIASHILCGLGLTLHFTFAVENRKVWRRHALSALKNVLMLFEV